MMFTVKNKRPDFVFPTILTLIVSPELGIMVFWKAQKLVDLNASNGSVGQKKKGIIII